MNFEGLLSAPNASTYGLAIDDMVWEWSETHPKNQTPNNKCTGAADGGGTDGGSGAGAGSLGTDGSGTDDVVAQCGSIALGSDLLFESSVGIPTQVVDGNANSGSCTGAGTINTTTCTQGTIDCSRYGLGATFSNDCDGDGFFEVEIQGFNLEEPEGEFFRLEQVSASSAIYIGTVPVSSTLNAKRDGVMFTQWRGVIVPQLTVRYIDKYDGIHPFNNGTDGKPGIALVDDDRDSLGPDKKPGRADVDDDGTGQCDATSSNAGSTCNADAGCAGSTRVGRCILVDDARESCRDRDGNGLLTNDRAFGDDDNGDGTCGQLTDEADELCPSGGVKTTFSDDNCGCTINPREYVTIQLYQDADIAYAFNRVNEKTGTGGDIDGFADSREVMLMTMTVRNFSSSPIEDLTIRLSTRDDDIACITDDTSFIGNMGEKGGNLNASFATTPQSDRFEFYVANVSRTSMEQSLSALFYMTATGTLIADDGTRVPFFGTTSPQSFSMDLDIDASLASITSLRATDKRTIGFNTNIGPGDQYATPAAFYSAWTASSFPNRPGLHCQYNDPTNPFVTSTAPPNCFLQQDTGTIVVDNDRDNVADAGNSDWHLHRNASRGNGIRGHDTSVTNVAEQVMHLGFHDRNGATCTGCQNSGVAADVPLAKGSLAGNDWDTVHLDNIMQVYYNTPFRLGLARGDYDTGTAGVEEDRATLSFWHMMALPDDRMFGLSPPQSFDGGAVYVLIDRDDDGTPEPGSPTDTTRDGFWKRINPYYGIPTQQPQAFGNCRYDPDDEGSTEKDIAPGEFIFGPSTTCFPEIVWACVGDTQNDDTYNGLFGEVPTGNWCYIENPSRIKGATAGLINGASLNIDENNDGATNSYDATGGIAGCTGGNCQGFGNWVETKFDLGEFRGRSVFIRFLVSTGQFGLNNWIEAFDPLNDNTFTGNRDDGWYIDDIVLTGLQSSGSTFRLKPDADTPPNNSCPASACSSNPTARLYVGTYPVRSNNSDDDSNAKTDENDEVKNGDTNTDSDAPGRLVDLVATKRSATLIGSTVTQCIGGQLEYKFVAEDFGDDSPSTVAPFSTQGTQTDDPEYNTVYTVTARCTSVPGCAATDTATVCVNGASNLAAPFLVVDGTCDPDNDGTLQACATDGDCSPSTCTHGSKAGLVIPDPCSGISGFGDFPGGPPAAPHIDVIRFRLGNGVGMIPGNGSVTGQTALNAAAMGCVDPLGEIQCNSVHIAGDVSCIDGDDPGVVGGAGVVGFGYIYRVAAEVAQGALGGRAGACPVANRLCDSCDGLVKPVGITCPGFYDWGAGNGSALDYDCAAGLYAPIGGTCPAPGGTGATPTCP